MGVKRLRRGDIRREKRMERGRGQRSGIKPQVCNQHTKSGEKQTVMPLSTYHVARRDAMSWSGTDQSSQYGCTSWQIYRTLEKRNECGGLWVILKGWLWSVTELMMLGRMHLSWKCVTFLENTVSWMTGAGLCSALN